jgi:hypothetical protein
MRRLVFPLLVLIVVMSDTAPVLDTVDQATERAQTWRQLQSGYSGSAGSFFTSLMSKAKVVASTAVSTANKAGGSLFGELVPKVLAVSSDKLQQLVKPLANLVYVFVMLVGFSKLPANFMLVVGGVTILFGPVCVIYFFRIVGFLISTAAYAPFVIVLGAWSVLFLSSAVFQRMAHAMGLDLDGDGTVDSLDMLWWCANTRVGRICRLHELHVELKKWRQSASDMRLEKIEALLSDGGGDVKGKGKGGPAAASSKYSSLFRSRAAGGAEGLV